MPSEARRLRLVAAARWLTLAPLPLAVLAIGGVHRETQALLTLCWGVALGTTLLSINRRQLRAPRSVAWLACAVVVVGGLQLIPLPPSVVGTLSPLTAEWYEFLFAVPGGAAPRTWRPLAVAPQAAWAEVVLSCGYFVQFLLLLRLFRRKETRRWPLYCLVGLGALSFLIALVHTAAGAERILGLYAPQRASAYPFMATFVNPNFQASFFGMVGLASLGLSRSRRVRGRARLLVTAASVCCLVGLCLTLSRGALVLLPLALLLFFVLTRRSDTRAGRVVLVSAALLAALALWLDAAGVGRELSSLLPGERPLEFAKANLWSATLPMVRAFWPAGVGPGGFAVSFSHFAPEMARARTYLEPENLLLQLVTQYGVPAGLLVLAIGAWSAVSCVSRVRLGRTSAGVAAGLAFGLVHELAGFGLSAPGIMIVVVTLAAFLFARHTGKERSTSGHGHGVRLGPVVLAGLLALCLAGTASLAWRRDGSYHLQAARLRALADAKVAEREFELAFEEARRLCPTYWYIYAQRAKHMLLRRSPGPVLHWVNRALFLHPRAALAHVLASEALRGAGRPEQAADELRLAVADAVSEKRIRGLFRRSLDRGATGPALMHLAGDDVSIQAHLLHVLIERNRAGLALMLAERLGFEARAQGDERAERALANLLFSAGRYDDLERVASAMVEHHPDSALAWYWHARAARGRGDLRSALERARRARGLARQQGVRSAVVDEEGAICELRGESDCLVALVGDAMGARVTRARIYLRLGRTRSRQGDTSAALADLHLARRLWPESTEPPLVLGRVLAKARAWRLAAVYFGEVLDRHPEHAEAKLGKAAALRAIEEERVRSLRLEYPARP